jgi:hypothetical protein
MDTGKTSSILYELCDNTEEMLRESFDPIQKLLLLFRNNFQYLMMLITLIEKEIGSDSKEKEAFNTLIDLFCHQFYENLLIQKTEQEELLILLYSLIEKEIENMYSASVTSFLDEETTFVGKLLKSYTKKQEIKTYLGITLGSLIMKIDNSRDKCIDVNLNRLHNHVIDKKRETKNKSYNTERWKNLLGSGIDNENLTKAIRRSTIARKVSFRSMNSTGEDLITYTLKEGTYVTNLNSDRGGIDLQDNLRGPQLSEFYSKESTNLYSVSAGKFSSSENLNIKMEMHTINSCTDINNEKKSDLDLNLDVLEPVKAKSNNNLLNPNNEYFLSIVGNVDNYKYMDSDEEFNTDYMIEITRDELRARMHNETDENMKEFCKNNLMFRYQAIRKNGQ